MINASTILVLVRTGSARIDRGLVWLATTEHRLIGLSIFRLIIGVCGVEYYVSDLGHRDSLWGPDSYISLADARASLPRPLTSLYFLSNSHAWFELVFFAGLAVAVAFTIFGGRALTVVHAVFLWSIYERNQDILEGGDNLVRIALIFLAFAVTDRYLTPRSKRLRERAAAPAKRPGLRHLSTMSHNIAVTLIVFQVVVVYTLAGYYKLVGSLWNTGVAMYYISHINQFMMFDFYPKAMDNLWIGWAVTTFTIVVECAVPFIVFTRRRWLREFTVAGLEAMHGGIIVFMGLVAFGLIMIGADFTLLKDSDYLALRARLGRMVSARRHRRVPEHPGALTEQDRASSRRPHEEVHEVEHEKVLASVRSGTL